MNTHIAFSGHKCLVAGSLREVALDLHARGSALNALHPLLFELESGRQIDIDISGSKADVIARLPEEDHPAPPEKRKRGRPKLGVVGREVTLLPRHWEWLDRQRGGASATLRRLIEDARKSSGRSDEVRTAQDRSNRFMSAIAGDLPGFEEATRALYSGNETAFQEQIREWPKDVRRYTLKFAEGAF